MALKGLPDSYQSFVAVMIQNEKKQTFAEFKAALRSFEETERSRATTAMSDDAILKSAEKIRNKELWERAGQEPVAKQILRRKWGWIGHTLRKPASSTTRQALTWNPQGKRKRGQSRNSWRRDTEAELSKQGTNWTGRGEQKNGKSCAIADPRLERNMLHCKTTEIASKQ
nr:hypothetical protein BaRGS_032400 [Batillaria attramentaria]